MFISSKISFLYISIDDDVAIRNGKCYMQSSSAFLYAEWAGRLGFLLLEYDCRMVPIILQRTVRFTTIVVGLGLSWLACRRINCLPLAAAPGLPEDFGSGENSQQFNFLLTRGRPKVESF